jgi:hypothetical protein
LIIKEIAAPPNTRMQLTGGSILRNVR